MPLKIKYMHNLFAIPATVGPTAGSDAPEYLEILARGADCRIERIISHGQTTPEGLWYDQDEDEWVALLAGSARLLWDDGRESTLHAGDSLLIPRHARHRVTYTSTPCVWIAVFGKMNTSGGWGA